MENTLYCMVKAPYPPVKVSGRSKRYADLLSEAYAGQMSELSAATLYLYQHLITEDKRLSDALSCISRVEMYHMSILGELITLYGGLPRMGAQMGSGIKFWSGQYVMSDINPRVFLRKNLQTEDTAIKGYRRLIKQIDDEPVKAILERIVLDEELHVKILTKFLDELNQSNPM